MSELNAYYADLDATLLMTALGGLIIWLAMTMLPLRDHPLPPRVKELLENFGLWLFLGALGLRLLGLGSESLWYDEAYSARLAGISIPDMLTATAGDVHPPLYYLVLKVFAVFGHNEFALRLPAALAGAAASVMVWRIASWHFDQHAARLAGVTAAILPGLLRYGQEARMYSFLALLLLWAYAAQQRGQWRQYTVALALALWTHAYALLYALALALPFGKDKHHRMAATITAGLLFTPWLGHLVQQTLHVSSGFWIAPLTLGRVLEPFIVLTTGLRSPAIVTVAGLVIVFLLTIYGLAVYPAVDGKARLLVFIVLPPALAAAFSVIVSPVYLPRGFIAGAYLLPVLWISVFRQRRTLLAVGTMAAVVGLVFWFFPVNGVRQDIQALINAWGIQPGDAAYHIEIGSYVVTDEYLPVGVFNYIYPYASDLTQSLTPETKAAMDFPSITLDAVIREQTPGRVFVVIMRTPFSSPAQIHEINRVLEQYPLELILAEQQSLRSIEIYELGL